MVALDSLEPCPVQPRINHSMRLIDQLADSMEAGRHQPLLEVEPLQEESDRYQIVCGEQRWRAARQAGLSEVLVRVLPPLSYLDRLRKQLEENRLRGALDPVEAAHAILGFRVLLQIERAEALLDQAGVRHQPLEAKRIRERADFQPHLEELQQLLVETGTHVLRSGGEAVCGPLSAWSETERALGISEASRKQKVGILRLPSELQEEVRQLPAEHAIQISRLDNSEQQAALVKEAPGLTHRQVRTAVDRLRGDRQLTVEQALQDERGVAEDGGPLGFENQLLVLADLCRQLARRLGYLQARLTAKQRQRVSDLLGDLRLAMDSFE